MGYGNPQLSFGVNSQLFIDVARWPNITRDGTDRTLTANLDLGGAVPAPS